MNVLAASNGSGIGRIIQDVRQLRGLLPYVLVSALVVVASVVAIVVSTTGGPADPGVAASASPTAAASASRQAVTDLSTSGRLAYWRAEPNGDHQLWLANTDNSRRRSVAKTDTPNTITKTKWSVDGGRVAYVEGGIRLVVVRIDGATTSYTLAPELRADAFRIVDHRFSPSGARIAATVQRQTGSQSDIYVAAANGTWTRITTVEDAIAGDWLDEDELLVQTTGGVISAVRASGTNQFRPLTGLQSSSPVIGSDGRIHFLAGRVTQFAGASETFVFAAAANVWSMTADGTDVRREVTPPDQDSLRLDGTWASGYLYHRGTNPAQLVIGSIPILLPSNAGLIERIAVAPDKRYAIGFAGPTVVRVDITPAGLAPSAILLLGSIDAGDVWFPRATPLARAAPAPRADAPAGRYTFALGGNIWTMGPDGVASVLRTGASNAQTQRRFTIPLPKWSPTGDRILTVESLGTGAAALQLIPVTIDRTGRVTRLTALSSVAPAVAWSPDGSQIAAVALPASPQDPSILLSELNVRIVSLEGALGQSIPGREVAWAGPGMFVLTNGTIRANDRARDEQTLELWTGTQKRTVTTVARIIGDPRALSPSTTKGITSVSNVTAAADGTYAAVRVAFLGTTATPFLVLLRASDGAATQYVLADRFGDEAWSPTRPLIGYTLTLGGQGIPGTPTEPKPVATIRDAANGAVVAEVDGRFAGWSPDGAWFYVATSGGLYARPLSGGALVRVSGLGVPVSITKP
jgi:Tol biopolymer transport system component